MRCHRPPHAARTLQLKINSAVTAAFHGHQIAIRKSVCDDRTPHPAHTLPQKIRDAITAPLHRHQIVANSWVRNNRAQYTQQRGHCALPWPSSRKQKWVHGDRAPHSARRLRQKIRGAITAPIHRHQIIAKSWLRGDRTFHATRTLQLNTNRSVTGALPWA